MSRARRLQPLQKLAVEREQVAARALAQARATTSMREAKLEQLQGYLREYQQGQGTAMNVADPRAWQNRQAFLLRLQAAVRQQEGLVTQARNEEVASLGCVVDRLLAEEAVVEQRQERRQQDEFAARVRWHGPCSTEGEEH
jgi:flagellar biosynthesis chaperone FliJ